MLPTRAITVAAPALLVIAAVTSVVTTGGTLDDTDDLDTDTELHANISFVEREGETPEPDGPAIIDVRSSNDSTILEVEVTYNVTGGTADADDHDGGDGTLVFDDSGQVRTIELTLADDDVHEDDETVTLTLSSDDPTVVFGTRNHTHAILDDPANQSPEAPDAEVEIAPETAVSGTLPGSDPDGDALTWTVAIPPGHGTVDLRPETGEYTYTPDPGFAGSDAFDYSVSDGEAVGTGTVSITVADGGSSDDGATGLDGSGDGSTDHEASDGDATSDTTEETGDGTASTGASDDGGDTSDGQASRDAGGTGSAGDDLGAAAWFLAGGLALLGLCAGLLVYGLRRAGP